MASKKKNPSIRIGAIEYEIKHTDDLRHDDTELMGCIIHTDSTIHLRTGMSDQITPVVLLHEIIHGILSNAGVKKHSEHVIDALAYGLLELERNNPGVLKINLEGLLK